MSEYRTEQPFNEDDRFTFEDSMAIKNLLDKEPERLSLEQRIALHHLYNSYRYMTS